jgi:cellulose synthase/poly-beta-1,6-N-acetylglucosamine synthase-like glycosyltransferase
MGVIMSVVVPTFNRNYLLAGCLKALRAQNFESSGYEIIVVDNAVSPWTARLVGAEAAASPRPKVRYLSEKKPGPAAARNSGWRAAAGEYIAFTDDDCVPDRDWLRFGLRSLSAGAAGVSGRIVVPLRNGPHDHAVSTAGLETAEFATANCFYRRAALESVGGFDERFTSAWREDADLFFTLLERKEQLLFSRNAVVVHPVRPAPWGVSVPQQKKSMFNALLYKKHPELFRSRIQRQPPLRYYAIILCFITALAGTLSGKKEIAFEFTFGWLGLTVFFAVDRLRGASRQFSHVIEMALTSLIVPFLSVFWRLYGAVKFRVAYL